MKQLISLFLFCLIAALLIAYLARESVLIEQQQKSEKLATDFLHRNPNMNCWLCYERNWDSCHPVKCDPLFKPTDI